MDRVKDKPPEVLDDLRQKRLAYFQATSATKQHVAAEPRTSSTEGRDNFEQETSKTNIKIEKADLQSLNKKYKADEQNGNKSLTNGYENSVPTSGMNKTTHQKAASSAFITPSTSFPNKDIISDFSTYSRQAKLRHSSDGYSAKDDRIAKTLYKEHTLLTDGNVEASTGQIKTTAFYFSNPETTNNSANATIAKPAGQNFDSISKVSAFVPVKTQPVNDPVLVDGYDETVERLIKATKDELLGNQVKDDIWSSFRRGSDAGSDRSAITQTKTQGKGYLDEKSSNEKDFKPDNNNVYNNIKSSASLREFSTVSNNRSEHVKADTTYPKYVETPTYSEVEPIATVSHQARTPAQLSGKVDEIFQSQQVHHIQRQVPVTESQDIEQLPVCLESLDLTELGLSTHRPESEREVEELVVNAKDINLGDTISEELRSALGENKYQEFLVKSKRDLDDLHERFSDRSTSRQEKFPRNHKIQKIVGSKISPRNVSVNTGNNEFSKDMVKAGEKVRKSSFEGRTTGQLLKRPQETIPASQDKDVSPQPIGQNIGIVSKSDFSKQLKSNPGYKPKKQASVNTSFEHSQTEIQKSVPDLNLLEASNESPRTKLNRPKHEPLAVYPDRTGILRNSANAKPEMFSSTPSALTSSKNYEQVTVPRNVAFSANEIYHQAYGNESVLASSVEGISASPSITSGVPTSPQTPVGYAHPAVSMMYSTSTTVTTHTASTTYHTPHPPTSVYSPYPIQYSGAPSSDPPVKLNTTVSRQSSVTMDTTPVPHPPGYPAPTTAVSSASVYGEYQTTATDQKGFAINRYSPPMIQSPPLQMVRPPLDIKPHPPPMPPAISSPGYSTVVIAPHPSVPDPVALEIKTHPALTSPPGYPGVPTGYPHQHPGIVIAPHPPVTESMVMSPSLQSHTVGSQTDRSDKTNDAVTIVEESTFTSVSQIESPKDVTVPHPPPAKRDGMKKVPRKLPKPEVGSGIQLDTKRHIDGVRQHHEQRRQEQDVDRMSEGQNVEKQRKFAKASLDRYFSSLEQLYISTKRSSISESITIPDDDDVQNDNDIQNDNDVQNVFAPDYETEHGRSVNKSSVVPLTQAHVSADELNDNYGIDQDYQNAVRESKHVSEFANAMNSENVEYSNDRFGSDTDELIAYKPVDVDSKSIGLVNNKQLLNKTIELSGENNLKSETMDWFHHDKIGTETTVLIGNTNKDDPINNEHSVNHTNDSDDGGETLVTTFTIKAGGITERLDELGIDSEHLKHTTGTKPDENQNNINDNNRDKIEQGSKQKQGKILLVCPECQGLNKEYMSWCTHCGEMLIGVDPVLVSKNREGKLRMKPVDSGQNKVSNVEYEKMDLNTDPVLQTEKCDINQIQEKPFSLDFGSISCKSPQKESGIDNINNLSPLKSDGVDSGRPSSDDHDQELQVYRIEQEVVDDICETITDPVVKGYVKSHFAKSHHIASLSKQSLPASTKMLPSWKNNNDHNLVHEIEHETTDIQTCDNKSEKPKDFSLEAFTNAEERLKLLTTDLEYSNNIESQQLESELKQHLNQSQHLISELQSRKQALDAQAMENVQEPQNEIMDFNIPPSPSHEALLDEPPLIPPPILQFADNIPAPVLPQFSAGEPVSRSELALKLPANSMDYSQFSSIDVSNAESVIKGDGNNTNNENAKTVAENAAKTKVEERQARRNRRGHGAIDVEIFAYEESHECRNSSHGQRMVPVLNLPLGSSDEEDMSLQSDNKDESLQPDFNLQQPPLVANTAANAWVPPAQEEQEFIPKLKSSIPAGNMSRSAEQGQQGERHDIQEGDWQRLFQPFSEMGEASPTEADQERVDDLDPNRPFLEHLISQSEVKAKKPKSSNGKPIKSKVRQSIETPVYQRKWARSSTAWSSYNRGELSTTSSLTASTEGQGQSRNASRGREQVTEVGNQSARSPSPEKLTPGRGKKSRPASADLYRRKQQKQRASSGHQRSRKSRQMTNDDDDDTMIGVVEHRLPRLGMLDLLHDHMASPNSTYDKYLQMTPRIEAGQVSRWQCLPDEILLHIFMYLDQADLTRCTLVCQQFYRVAMDESLWKYITIKKRPDLDDGCLMEISRRHPVSLALLQCQGDQVTAKGLRDLFKECANTLKELNVSRCSRGALSGDSLLLHAAARCHNLTHVDTSWCHLTDSGLIAISNSCRRLESLCINGCQAVSNDGLETVIRQHGTSLRVLELCGCFNITPRGLRCIANNCINLLTLSVGQCYKLTDSCIAQLSASLGRVETLDLRGCKQIKDNCIRRVVKNCTRLKHLSLANCPSITDVSVLEISTYLTDIRSMDVCGCKNISDSSIRAMVNTCTNLRNIDISSTGCTHRSVSMIANFSSQRLETLKLNFLSDITEQSLIKLAKHCRRLRTVHLYGCTSVRNLDKVRDERPTFSIEM